MKKILSACTMLLLLFFYSFFTMAKAEIPSSIYALLPQAEITSTAFWEEDTRNTCFLLTHKEDGTNTLYCFIHENSIWAECFHTTDAIPQGNNAVVIHLSEGAWDFNDSTSKDGQYYRGPILLILQYSEDGRSIEQNIVFQRVHLDTWNLIFYKNYVKSADMKIDDNTITYYTVADKAQTKVVGIAHYHVQRNLRSFALSDIPLSFQQAQELED